MEIKTILVPTDFSEHAEYAYKWALGLAADCKAKVILFYAAPTMSHLA
jgi:nucleotide-binding universal stress UspA family protein